jgi:hypothetical protein
VTAPDELDSLSVPARERLERFAAALERVHVDDLPLYAVRARQPAHRRAVERAAVRAAEAGLTAAIEAASSVVTSYVSRAYANAQFRTAYVGLNTAPGLGPADDRVGVMRSLNDAVTAIVLDDALDAADHAELVGGWARLLDR